MDMHWKIKFSQKSGGETSVIVGPFPSLKKRNDFRTYWEKELMADEQCRGDYEKVHFIPRTKLSKKESSLLPKDFNGIPAFFRFTIH